MKLKRNVDLRLLRHVNTRGASHYKITLPPSENDKCEFEDWDGELGIWFETEWGSRQNIIVKGTKQGKFVYNNTDVHVGDELISIDDIPVKNLNFGDAMKLLKDRLANVWESYKTKDSDTKRLGTLISKSSNMIKPKFLKSLKNSIEKNSPTQNYEIAGDIDEVQNSEEDRIVLTFRTLEERTRRTRSRALKKRHFSSIVKNDASGSSKENSSKMKENSPVNVSKDEGTKVDDEKNKETSIYIDMKLVNQSIFVYVRNFDETNPPYRIENRAMNHIIYFRQRGCDAHAWNSLSPGESVAYSWEEPMKQKKLIVRVGNNIILYKSDDKFHDLGDFAESNKIFEKVSKTDRTTILRGTKKMSPFNFVENEEHGSFGKSCLVRLENIGFHETLQCPIKSNLPHSKNPKNLYCYVDCDGATRVLIITDNQRRNDADEGKLIEGHLESISKQIDEETLKLRTFKTIKNETNSLHRSQNATNQDPIHAKLRGNLPYQPLQQIVEDTYFNHDAEKEEKDSTEQSFGVDEKIEHVHDLDTLKSRIVDISDIPDGTAITSTNQLLIEVIEAAGLKSNEFGGLCNPYCELILKCRTGKRRKNIFFSRSEKKRTYFVEKSVSPKWSGMIFLFDIPSEAVHVTRGYSIVIKIKSLNVLGKDTSLGMTEIHLRSLKNQQELIGWYPLMHGKVRGRELLHRVDLVKGSVKLRVQWIHSIPALLKHHSMLSKKRLSVLQHSADGMVKQLENLRNTIKLNRDMGQSVIFSKMPNFKDKNTPIYDQQDLSLMNESKWKVSTLKQNLRSARERYLYSLHINTEQSKISRRASSFLRRQSQLFKQPVDIESLVSVNDPSLEIMEVMTKPSQTPETEQHSKSPINPPVLSSSSTQFTRRMKKRSATAPDTFWKELETLSSTHDGPFLSKQSSFSSLDFADESERQHIVNLLFNKKILYHETGYYFHRHFPTHNIRSLLFVPNITNKMDSVSPVSKRRALSSINQLRDWNEAYYILNCAKTRKRLVSSPRESSEILFRNRILTETAAMYSDHPYPSLALPIQAPAIQHERHELYLKNLHRSRGKNTKKVIIKFMSLPEQMDTLCTNHISHTFSPH